MDRINLLLDAIFLEHWARYFCFEEIQAENNDSKSETMDARIEIPELLYSECLNQVPHLQGLLEKIQHSPIVLGDVKSAIFSFVQEKLGLNDEEFAGFMHEMGLNADFNARLNTFYGFVQEEADKDSKTEDSMNDKEYRKYREEKTIPLFLTWIEQCHNWAKENNYPF